LDATSFDENITTITTPAAAKPADGAASTDTPVPAAEAETTTTKIEPALYRRDGLHLFGVDELSTRDIFVLFSAYNPYAMEWINDSSCNLLWRSETQVLRCVCDMTARFDPDDVQQLRAVRGRPPRGFKWRVSREPALPKSRKNLFVRFIRKQTDRKRKGAEAKSMFYVRYGNPNYGNLTGLISESKRRAMKMEQLAMIEGGTEAIDLEREQEAKRKLISYNFGKLNFLIHKTLN
jgi:hypothetical protein